MYISQIRITNFRNFKAEKIDFNDGVNVIIGHNNAGKTNLLKALSLVLDYEGKKRLGIDDFNKKMTLTDLEQGSPKISISITIKKGTTSSKDDLVTISNWLTTLNADYEAILTYEFFLPEKHEEDYKKSIAEIDKTTSDAADRAWKAIKFEFIRLYTYKIWGGEVANKNQADGESLQKFDFQFLNAIRDVERDLLTGRNIMLRDVLHFFLDYDIKKLDEATKPEEDKKREIKARSSAFSKKADDLLKDLHFRMEEGKSEILSYAKETGASAFQNSMPNFEGATSDVDMLYFLRLIIEQQTGVKIPASHNGLGYNNLIFMSLLLAKMQVNADGNYLGSNAKVFSTLAIEEPEAHLHPSMQYKFLKFLKENKNKRKVRQIFVTTHSTHITSAVELDEIICLNDNKGTTLVGYPGKVFPDNRAGTKSKKYVQRFLDATKSDMLFAQRILFVEGVAEQLLFSCLAKYIGESLEDKHVAIINVGGRYFNHFIRLFDTVSSSYAINKRIACVTDRDPEHLVGKKFKKCYPFEYDKFDTVNFRDNATSVISHYLSHPNIRFFSQDEEKGKTFEYDLILFNHKSELLITESLSNKKEIRNLMKLVDKRSLTDYLNILSKSDENDRIKKGISGLGAKWSEDEKKKAIIASRYLNSVGKGENALELAYTLEKNLQKDTPEAFNVPSYISEAIVWICQ